MKQSIITRYGKPDFFEIREKEIPEPGEGEILVKNFASSVNPVDTLVRSGKLRLLSGWSTPKVLGGDFGGEVIKTKHQQWKVGDEVFGMLSPIKGGAYSEYIVCDGDKVAMKPAHLDIEEAGVLTIAWLTAFQALVTFGKLKEGEEVFINGCTGGVGSAAVKMAVALGAKVTGTCSGPNMDFAKSIGVTEVYDYKKIPLHQLKMRYDLVFDAATKMSWGNMKKIGKPGARFAITNNNPVFILLSLFSSKMKLLNGSSIIDRLPDLSALLEQHKIKPDIDKSFLLEELGAAHHYFEENSVQGKVKIRIK